MSRSKNHSKGINRRDFVKGTLAATAAMATVGPWVISSSVLASSGELNVLMWSDYLPPVTRYEVNGPVRDPESWSEGREESPAD